MRVAFYTPYKSPTYRRPSGDRTVARNLIKALEQNGHHVRVMSEFPTKRFWVQWKRWKQLPSSLFAAYRAAKAYRPEAWLTFVSDRHKPDFLGPLFSSWLGIPYVIYQAPFRGDYKRIRRKEGGGKHLWMALPGYLLNLLALYSADHVIVDKSSDYVAYLRHSRIGPKLLFLQLAVSVQEFFPDVEERQRIRRALKIPEGICVILSVSRLAGKLSRSPEERYGTPKALSVRFLIDCVSDLLKQGHGVKLLIVGDGERRRELEAYAKRLGGAVSFIGAIEHAQVRSYYNAADIFAFPGFREPHALVWLEAQACGLPVVAFSNEVVRHQETGLLVAPLDREGFVRSLEQLVQDETLRKTMGRAAAEYVKNCHDTQQWGQRLSGCLERPR